MSGAQRSAPALGDALVSADAAAPFAQAAEHFTQAADSTTGDLSPRAEAVAPPANDPAPIWVFGYGSLIYKVDFEYLERRPARLQGWARRFWQGSHDHRGTPAAPGRVVTLIPAPGAVCAGMAYRIRPSVFAHLDHREKNGYAREPVELCLDDGQCIPGIVYLARPGNPAYLGAADEADIARHIAAAHGPSGANRDYLYALAAALHELGSEDAHVFAIEQVLRGMEANVSAASA